MFENALETLTNAEAEFRTECGAWARSARIGEHQSAERKLSCAPSAAVHLSLLVWVIMYLVVVEPSWRYKVPGGVFSHLQFDIARGRPSDPSAKVCVKWYAYACVVLYFVGICRRPPLCACGHVVIGGNTLSTSQTCAVSLRD